MWLQIQPSSGHGGHCGLVARVVGEECGEADGEGQARPLLVQQERRGDTISNLNPSNSPVEREALVDDPL
jgi:hypothetical protein